MKTLTEIFQILLGIVALLFTSLIAFGRLVWRKIRNRWKKSAKWIRCSIAVSFLLIAIAFAALIAYALYEDNYGRYWEPDMYLSNDIVVYYYSDGKYRVYDESTKKYTTPRIDWVTDAEIGDSLSVYAVSGKRGFINVKNGKIVIDAKTNDYEKAWIFSEGLAAVMSDGKIGFINANNELVIPFKFDYSTRCRMYGTGYLFHDDICIMTNKDGDIGLINAKGDWVVEPEYDEVWAPHKTGYRVVVNDGKHGVLDIDGNVVYPTEYAYVDIVSDGFVLTKGGRMWQVDYEGNMVNPFMFSRVYDMEYKRYNNSTNETEYVLADYMEYDVMGLCGILNRITGKPVTPALYYDVEMISEKLFRVQDPDSYEWYIIDVDGNIVK